MITEWLDSLTLTHVLLMIIIVLMGIIILSIRALIIVFYTPLHGVGKGTIFNDIYRELLNIGGGMNLVVESTQSSSSDLCDIKDAMWSTNDEIEKLTRNIHTPSK